MTKFKTRKDKITFLNELQQGRQSLNEIVELETICLSFEDSNGDVFIKGPKNKLITRQEAKALRNRTGQKIYITVDGIAAERMYDEGAGTNLKAGPHYILKVCAGCDPIVKRY